MTNRFQFEQAIHINDQWPRHSINQKRIRITLEKNKLASDPRKVRWAKVRRERLDFKLAQAQNEKNWRILERVQAAKAGFEGLDPETVVREVRYLLSQGFNPSFWDTKGENSEVATRIVDDNNLTADLFTGLY